MSRTERARPEETILLVVDIQEKLVALMDQKAALLKNATTLIAAAQTLHFPIVLTEQYPEGLGGTVAEIAAALGDGGDDATPFEKLTFSCFGDEAVAERLSALGRKRIVLTGIEAHICVQQTALDLAAAGYAVTLPADAVCSRRKADWQQAIERMRAGGATITTTEAIVFELLERAGTPAFKALLPRFK